MSFLHVIQRSEIWLIVFDGQLASIVRYSAEYAKLLSVKDGTLVRVAGKFTTWIFSFLFAVGRGFVKRVLCKLNPL